MRLPGLHRALIGVAIVLYAVLAWRNYEADFYAWRLSNIIKSTVTSDQEIVDMVREMVYRNTIHLPLGDNDPQTTSDQAVILRSIYQTHNDNDRPVAATCGPRAIAMRSILKQLRFETRLVQLFSDDYPFIQSHTFLEVKVDGRWQAHDPDLNIYYADGGNRTDTMLAFLGLSHPVGGWDKYKFSDGSSLLSYFEALMFDGRPGKSAMIINRDKFDLDRVFPGDGVAFPEFAKIYGELEWGYIN